VPAFPQTPDADTYLAIVDTLYRFAAGQDLRDEALFRSAWTADAELDFVQPAERLGVKLAPFRGRETVVTSIMGSTGALVTSHTVTNARVQLTGAGTADLVALVEAQHVPHAEPGRHLLLKNVYRCQAALEERAWRIRTMRIHNLWMHGEPGVLFPGAR
jgi:hypothetical protein